MAVERSNFDVAAETMKAWRHDPLRFVREVFRVEPDPWQRDVLEAFPHNQRQAMKACRGPGKTCVLAWLVWNFLLTRPNPNIAATSVTKDNLADGLWKELSKWQQKSPLLTQSFEWQKTRVVARNPDLAPNWWASARNWSKTADVTVQSDTLAGLHADYIMFVIDESGGVPDAIMSSAEAALSSCVEGHLVQAGNPTQLEGPLYRACTSARKLWWVIEISSAPDDPKRTPRVSAEWAQEQIDEHGRDNPWVIANIFGQFPPSSIDALIGPDEVEAAMKRVYREHEIANAPKVLGVDVARFGDDSSVLFPRQGLQALTPSQYRNLDGLQGASLVNRKMIDWKPDAVFIDNSGGFGSSWIDQLKMLGQSVVPVDFGGAPTLKERYENKRAQMAYDAVQWIKSGGALPPCDDLAKALCCTTYSFQGHSGRMLLEPKREVKKKMHGMSPDHFDAFILTFAEPVSPRRAAQRVFTKHLIEYDPYADLAYLSK